jgi:hypothetical protein
MSHFMGTVPRKGPRPQRLTQRAVARFQLAAVRQRAATDRMQGSARLNFLPALGSSSRDPVVDTSSHSASMLLSMMM